MHIRHSCFAVIAATLAACTPATQPTTTATDPPMTSNPRPLTTDDPDPSAEPYPLTDGGVWRTQVDPAAYPALSLGDGYGLRGRFEADKLIVVFRVPEPGEVLAWTLLLGEGAPAREIHDRDAHPRGGNWVEVTRSVEPVPGMIYNGAMSIDVSPLIAGGQLAPGSSVIVRFGDAEVRVPFQAIR